LDTKEITSTANAAVKEAVRLRRKRHRHEHRLFLAEGEDLLAAALAGGHFPRQVFVLEGSVAGVVEALDHAVQAGAGSAGAGSGEHAPGATGSGNLAPGATGSDMVVYICSEPVMQKLSELGSGSRVVSVFDFIDRQLDQYGGAEAGVAAGNAASGNAASRNAVAEITTTERGEGATPTSGTGPLVYLAGVGDPGNAGAIIRSAAALGASGIVFSPNAVDPYSSKCQRAAMGAAFRLPLFLDVTAGEIAGWATGRGLPVVSSDPHQGMALWDEAVSEGRPLSGAFVLVLGSERKGVPGELIAASRLRLRIPQLPEAESLNVAMAGTVILYEALKQRGQVDI
jgi:tRNA G18 (ribose-2'-O)-methylase SpoU